MAIDFSELVKTRREALGMTRREVADKALCSISTMLSLEHYKRMIRMDILQDILGVLGLELIVREAQHDD